MSDFTREAFEWIKTIAAAVVIAMIINFFGGLALVDGLSMYPTLNNKDFLIFEKSTIRNGLPARGDIITFQSTIPAQRSIRNIWGKNKILVKRVIGLPGETVRVFNGKVYINGKELTENYTKDGFTNGELEVVVPEESVFVMGDNRLNSNDSRMSDVGFVAHKDLLGKVVTRIYPFKKLVSTAKY